MSSIPLISIFTPTYNRADRVHRVWDSIQSQTLKNFEWVIIDDGSTDDIESVVSRYRQEANFNIVFHKFEHNKGKHNATNKGLELAKGKFFMVADSDDGFLPSTLQVFVDTWNSIPSKDRINYCGVRACCNDQHGNRVSDRIPSPYLDATMAEAFYKHGIRKETWTMVLTDWHRKFLFPSDHIGYHPEGIIWKAMSRHRKLRWVDTPTRIYYVNDDPNSIMSIKKPRKTKVKRNIASAGDILNNDITYIKYDVIFFITTCILYTYYALVDESFTRHYNNITNWKSKVLCVLTLPVALLLFLFNKG